MRNRVKVFHQDFTNSTYPPFDGRSYSQCPNIFGYIEAAIAEEYYDTKIYNTGDLVFHDGILYRATDDNITGPFNLADWSETSVGFELANRTGTIGRFLSGWNCAIGKPVPDIESPYTYRRGDHYIISATATEGEANYKPDGAIYTGEASTEEFTEDVNFNDYIFYNGESWILIPNPTYIPVQSVDGRTGAVLTYRYLEYGEEDAIAEIEDALDKMQRIVCLYDEVATNPVELLYTGYSDLLKAYCFSAQLGEETFFATLGYSTETYNQWKIYNQQLMFVNGDYGDTTTVVRSAKQLISPDDILDSPENDAENNPFIFRTSAGSQSISDGLANIKKIRGKTYKWNQLLDLEDLTVTESGLTITYTKSDLSVTINGTAASDVYKEFGTLDWYSLDGMIFFGAVGLDNNCYFGYISGRAYPGAEFSIDAYQALGFGLIFKSGATFSNKKIYPKIVNLTTLYGSGNEPTTPEQFLKEYPMFYGSVPYTEGSISSVKPTILATVGFNAFNPATGKAFLLGGNEYQITGAYTALSYSTGETITPDADGKFTPAKNGELTVTGGNSITTCVHLTWSGYRNGEYESYWRESISTHIADYFVNGMHGVGGVYDELTPTKAIKRFGIVDLGTLEGWIEVSAGLWRNTTTLLTDAKAPASSSVKLIGLCNKYEIDTYGRVTDKITKGTIGMSNAKSIAIYDSSITSADAMNGVYLIYELATPVETEIDPPLNFNCRISDFGTEEFVFASGDTVLPVPCELFYQDNLVDKLRGINNLTTEELAEVISALD